VDDPLLDQRFDLQEQAYIITQQLLKTVRIPAAFVTRTVGAVSNRIAQIQLVVKKGGEIGTFLDSFLPALQRGARPTLSRKRERSSVRKRGRVPGALAGRCQFQRFVGYVNYLSWGKFVYPCAIDPTIPDEVKIA
jgi:hypothetical protein